MSHPCLHLCFPLYLGLNNEGIFHYPAYKSPHFAGEKGQRNTQQLHNKIVLLFSLNPGISSVGSAEKQTSLSSVLDGRGNTAYTENVILFILSGEVNRLTNNFLFYFTLKWTGLAPRRTLLRWFHCSI